MKLLLLVAGALMMGLQAFADHQQTPPPAITDYDQFYASEIHPYKIQDTEFRTGREYKYFYDGQAMTSIPGTSRQNSAIRIQCLVSIQIQNDQGKSLMKLSHIRMGHLNRNVPNPRAVLPFGVFEPAPIQPQLREQLEHPLKFKWEHGQVKDLVLDSKDEPWSVNIKRGILNMLQLQLKPKPFRPDMETNQIDHTGTQESYFRTSEKTLEGDCEVIYNIGSMPNLRHHHQSNATTYSPVLNVTKSINFAECQTRPEVKYNWRFQPYCPSCGAKSPDTEEKSIQTATVIQYNITGTREKFLIESCKVESHYLLVPFNQETNIIATYVNQTLVLYQTKAIETKIEEPRNPVESETDLIYSLEWDLLKEKFYLEGEQTMLAKNPYSAIPSKLEMVTDIVRKLVDSMHERVTPVTPQFLDRLITAMKMMNKQEIEQIYQEFYNGTATDNKFTSPEEKKRAKDMIINAMALCGTHACVTCVLGKIESGQLPTWHAVSALRQLHQSHVVSAKLITDMKRVAESPRIRDSFLLKQSVYLAFGSIVWTACGDNKDQMATESYQQIKGKDRELAKFSCSDAQKREFSDWMWSKFESAQKPEDRILCLKMIGNSGLNLNIQKLEKVIHQIDGRHYHLKTRVAAIKATWLLIEHMPVKIQRMLVPLMLHKYQDPELRIVAAYFTLQTFPDRPLLNMIAKDLNLEPNYQYKTFLWQYLQDLANSTNPCHEKFSTNLKLALRFAHQVQRTLTSSSIRHYGFFSDSYNFGYEFEPHFLMSNRSWFPRQLNLVQSGTGFLGKWSSTAGFSSMGLDDLLWKLMGPSSSQFGDSGSGSSKNSRWLNELQGIFDSMKVSPKFYRSPKNPLAYIYWRYLGQEIFYYPLLSGAIDHPASAFSAMQSLKQLLHKPFDLSFATVLSDFKYKIPTTLGLPVTFSYKTPLVATVKGQLQPQIADDWRSFALNVDLKPSVAVKVVESMELWTPVVNTGLRVSTEASVFTPIKAEMKYTIANRENDLKITFEPPIRTRELLTLQSRPATYTRVWPKITSVWQEPNERTIQGSADHHRVMTINNRGYSYLESLLGINCKVKGRVHLPPVTGSSSTTIPFCPHSGPNKLVVECEPGSSAPEKIEFSLKGKYRQSRDPISPEMSASPIWADESSSTESDQVTKLGHQYRERRSATVPLGTPETKQIRADRKHELVATLKTVGGAHKRELKLQTEFTYSPEFHFVKMTGKLNMTPLPKFSVTPFTTCFQSEFLYPTITNDDVSELFAKKVHGEIKVNWSPATLAECPRGNGPSGNFIKATLQAERSSQQLQMESGTLEHWNCRRSPQHPVGCQRYTDMASDLKKYVVNLEYKDVPVPVQNATNRLWRSLKNLYFWQTDVASIQVRNPENKISAIVRVDPFTNRLLNITVKTPKENVTMVDIPVPFPVVPLNLKKTLFDRIRERSFYGDQNAPICEISSERVKTFDSVEFALRMGNCWTVLAQDCSSERTFSVLAKKTNGGDQDELSLKIVTPFGKMKLVRNPNQKQIILEKDGKLVVVGTVPKTEITANGRVVIGCVFESDTFVKCHLPEHKIRVDFDGYNANIRMMAPIFAGRQCGACGNMDFDPNPETEFMKLDSDAEWYEPEPNIRKAFHNYTLKDAKCSRPENFEEMCVDEQCQFRPTQFPVEFQRLHKPYSLPAKFDFRPDVKPIRSMLKFERNGKICVSVRPLAQCPDFTYPLESVQVESIKFQCTPKYSINWSNYDSASSTEESGNAPTAGSSNQLQKSSTGKISSVERDRLSSGSASDEQQTEESETITTSASIPKTCRKF